jgi:hypothetical protein
MTVGTRPAHTAPVESSAPARDYPSGGLIRVKLEVYDIGCNNGDREEKGPPRSVISEYSGVYRPTGEV